MSAKINFGGAHRQRVHSRGRFSRTIGIAYDSQASTFHDDRRARRRIAHGRLGDRGSYGRTAHQLRERPVSKRFCTS